MPNDRRPAAWFLLPLLVTLLAGCADEVDPDSSADPVVDSDTFELETGKGAIAGLLVDDRFRPLQLTDDPQTEYQTDGFILLQETGQQVQTTADGLFTFVDLEPGQYTLRAQIDGHELSPGTVDVVAGEYAEKTLIARRIVDEGGTILTQEYNLFVFCAINAGVPLSDVCYNVDRSGDSGQVALYVDFTSLNGSLTAVVTEFLANQEGSYDLWMGHHMADLTGPTEYFMQNFFDGRYTRCLNVVGEVSACDRGVNSAFNLDYPLEYVWWINGEYDNEVQEAAGGLPIFYGVGANLAVEGKFLLSAFLGEPEVDLETYCVLCE